MTQATPDQIASSIGNARTDGGDGSLSCNNCGAVISEYGAIHSCVICLDGRSPGLTDLLCGQCRSRHAKGHGKGLR
jgi:hypothetical protein